MTRGAQDAALPETRLARLADGDMPERPDHRARRNAMALALLRSAPSGADSCVGEQRVNPNVEGPAWSAARLVSAPAALVFLLAVSVRLAAGAMRCTSTARCATNSRAPAGPCPPRYMRHRSSSMPGSACRATRSSRACSVKAIAQQSIDKPGTFRPRRTPAIHTRPFNFWDGTSRSARYGSASTGAAWRRSRPRMIRAIRP